MDKFDWRWAFDPDMIVSRRDLDAVREAILNWSDWSVETRTDGLIIRVEYGDGDGIWDYGYDDSEDVDAFFSYDFVRYMDKEFKVQSRKQKVVVGKATILPLPGERPQSSSKGATPSSSF